VRSESLTDYRRAKTVRQMEQSLYDTLRGNWSVNRVIDDRKGDQKGTFTGTAHFAGVNGTLLYTEEGHLSFAGTLMRAERRYHWLCEGQTADVSYEDGSFFHRLTVLDGLATAEHQCGEDLYRATYAFQSANDWQVTWRGSGPRKDYTSITTYERSGTRLQ